MPENADSVVLVVDIDNTMYDFVDFYGAAMRSMIHALSKATNIEEPTLMHHLKKVIAVYGTLDHAPLIENIEAFQGYDPERRAYLVQLGRIVFDKTRKKRLQAYPNIVTAFDALTQNSNVRIVAVTNAPFYHAYRRLSQLHLHNYFDGLVAWTGVKIAPGDNLYSEEFAQKYEKVRKSCSSSFGLFKTFEREHSKPSVLPFELVIRHFGAHRSYFSLGDSISKDLQPASKLGMQTIWARYGTKVDKKNLETVLFVTPWTENEIKAHNDTSLFSPGFTIDDPIELLSLLPIQQQQQLELL